MNETARIARAIDELERLENLFWELCHSKDGDWKRRYLELRREFQSHVGLLSGLEETWPGLTPDQRRDYRNAFGAFRSAVALHQADWPVVKIAENDRAFDISFGHVKTASRDFRDLVRAMLESR